MRVSGSGVSSKEEVHATLPLATFSMEHLSAISAKASGS